MLLSRVENLGHVLCWSKRNPADTDAGAGAAGAARPDEMFVEMPRLQARFAPKEDAAGEWRLFSLDFTSVYISETAAGAAEKKLMEPFPFSLLLSREGGAGGGTLLVPSYPVARPEVKACPFTTRPLLGCSLNKICFVLWVGRPCRVCQRIV